MPTRLSLFVASLALVWFALPNRASAAITTLGTYDTPGQAYGVAISGNYAYVVDIGVGVQVLDITNPAAPTLAATYAKTTVNRLALSGSRVYVTGSNTLDILDVTTPTNPVLLGSYTNADFTMGQIATDGSTAYIIGYSYVATGTQFKIAAVDVRTPASPSLLNIANTSGAADVTMGNGYIYTVGGQSLTIWNTALSVVGSYTDPSTSQVTPYYLGVAVSGNTAVVNDTTFGFHVIDVTNPAAPTQTKNAALGYGQAVVMSGTTAYASGLGGMSAITVATPASPQLLGKSGGTLTNVIDIAVAGTTVAVAALDEGVRFYNVAQADSIGPAFTFTTGTGTSYTLKPGAAFSDTATATDNLDGTVATYTKTGTVNRNVVGKYTLTYTATDAAGNITTTVRSIFVLPTSEALKMSRGTYTLTVGKKRVTLRPFPGYSGAVTARKFVVRTKADPYYVFIATSTTKSPAIVVYNAKGVLVKRQSLATVSTRGLNLQMVINPATSSILLSAAPKQNGFTASLFSINKNGLASLGKVKAASGRGSIIQKFLLVHANEYVLATKISGNTTAEPKLWRYSSAKKVFVQDTSVPVPIVLTWTKTDVKLRPSPPSPFAL